MAEDIFVIDLINRFHDSVTNTISFIYRATTSKTKYITFACYREL